MSDLRIDDFNFSLDDALIAQQPLAERDQSRLMVLDRHSAGIGHRVFSDLPGLLRRGDLLVLNDTQVIPAKFAAHRASGGKVEGLFLNELSLGRWRVMLKNAGKCRTDETLSIDGDPHAGMTLVENHGQGVWTIGVSPTLPAVEILEQVGSTPLPPYIHRSTPGGDSTTTQADRSRYQTVYATSPGAVAAPTAGLHFTPALFDELTQAGVSTARVTLHVGPGTFLPIKCDDVTRHQMHSEWYCLPPQTADLINQAKAQGRRVVGVGTTSVRVLETAARDQDFPASPLAPCSGWTDIFIYPPYRFGVIDALVTNFHLPCSTLLMLVAAFCSPGDLGGIGTILHAYRQAIEMKYRFFSYGDAMLIE